MQKYYLRGIESKFAFFPPLFCLGFLRRNNSGNEPKMVHNARKLFSTCLKTGKKKEKEKKKIKKRD